MARIDLYLNSIQRFGATGAVLASGGNVTLKFPAGDKMASQTTAHADLVTLVDEIAPGVASRITPGQRSTYPYTVNGKTWSVMVDAAGPTTWKVTIAPGDAAPAANPRASTPGPVAAPATAAVEDLIERTSYESVARPAAKPAPARMATPAPAAAAAAPAAPAAPPPEPEKPIAGIASTGSATIVEKMLIQMKEMGASDLHVSSNVPPMVRHHGEMKPLPGYQTSAPEQLFRDLMEITPAKNKREFEDRNDTDFAHNIPGVARFRANIFRDRHGAGAVFRQIPFNILTPDQLGIPKAVLDLCYLTKGLVVVTGPTGSGKSTTLAALIDYINKNRSDHLITIEDPIEFVHENKKCLVNQREVHTHTRSFKDALRAALREDPDIVLVGEMRDLETIAIAVETAETGHLVFGTLHTTTAPSTVDRIIDQFPADRQEQIRQMLSESLRGVIAQVLCKKIGGGRVAAYEILLTNHAVSNLIREKKTFQLPSMMQTGRGQGMVTLNDSLMELVKKGLVEPTEAYLKAVNKGEIKTALQREGHKIQVAE